MPSRFFKSIGFNPTRIYTDGSCLGNPGVGGWAWAFDKASLDFGGSSMTTNNRMELTAVIEALKSPARPKGPITVVSDSAYIVNCFSEFWYEGWSWSGVKIKTGEQVANWDLWKQLLLLVDSGEITFEKVKGHSGDPMNDFVDFLATSEARRIKLEEVLN